MERFQTSLSYSDKEPSSSFVPGGYNMSNYGNGFNTTIVTYAQGPLIASAITGTVGLALLIAPTATLYTTLLLLAIYCR